MPITKSAKKAMRQSAVRKTGNLLYKNKIKSLGKAIRVAAQKKESAGISSTVSAYYSAVDKAAKRGILHKNKARHLKAAAQALVKKELGIETLSKREVASKTASE